MNTWDDNMIHIQHSYNRGIHTSVCKSHFEMCFGYQPPSLQDVVYGKQEIVRENTINEALRAKKFIDKIRQIHLQVQGK